MAISVRLEPPHLSALAGSDVDGAVLLHNPGIRPVHVRLVVASEVGGWASIEPGELTLAPKADVACVVRFRLPRGAPGGVGSVPFTIRVLSDEEGEGGATCTGSLEVTGEAELAVRLLPPRLRGTLAASGRAAVDNLGDTPARVQVSGEGPDSVAVEVEPDSFTVEPGGAEMARVSVRPTRRLVAGAEQSHRFRVFLDPLGGARITAEGVMVQRSLVASVLPKAA
ncbi:MAG TPA: hypothetical protein VFO65_01720, partial [Acidimicrobiales bacterium]|nr:hypothetical protein [Acidimicrobiales bacterium]